MTRFGYVVYSIEEAEALATRTFFLHRGRLRLSQQHETPFSERGYEVTISLEGLQDMLLASVQEIEDEMQMLFRGRDILVTRLSVRHHENPRQL